MSLVEQPKTDKEKDELFKATVLRASKETEAGHMRSGSPTIGARQTPRKSTWPMRDKWKKYGRWFTCIGKDGDVQFLNGYGLIQPMVIQLFYHLLPDGQVEQLAWERFDLYVKWVQSGHEPSLDIHGEHMDVEFK